jgi:hypothetical protein
MQVHLEHNHSNVKQCASSLLVMMLNEPAPRVAYHRRLLQHGYRDAPLQFFNYIAECAETMSLTSVYLNIQLSRALCSTATALPMIDHKAYDDVSFSSSQHSNTFQLPEAENYFVKVLNHPYSDGV